ncbi:MAG: nucleotidyltransferase domain-containing protein [Gemmataceae bacterium]
MIDLSVRREIESRLDALEREEGCRILYACESGSRAWGFPSTDSDYDVRFIYVRPADWYLSINVETKRDVIERPIVDLIDLGGWDLRKALLLFAKTNPPLYEWLDSPILYRDDGRFAPAIRALMSSFYSPIAAAYHYLRMAKRTESAYMQSESVKLKKYFYTLRPLLAVRWIEQNRGPVPMLFSTLLTTIEDRPELRREIDQLLVCKMAGEELGDSKRNKTIDEFQRSEFERLEGTVKSLPPSVGNQEDLNRLFRETIRGSFPG